MALVCLSLHFIAAVDVFHTIVFVCRRHVEPNEFLYLLHTLEIPHEENYMT